MKHLQQTEIPTQTNLEYSHKVLPMPSGPTISTPMSLEVIGKTRHSYRITSSGVDKVLAPINEFIYCYKPITQSLHSDVLRGYMRYYQLVYGDYLQSNKHFATEDDAYLELFFTLPHSEQIYPDKYLEIKNKYPEYFI